MRKRHDRSDFMGRTYHEQRPTQAKDISAMTRWFMTGSGFREVRRFARKRRQFAVETSIHLDE
jgi:hypothetical protein